MTMRSLFVSIVSGEVSRAMPEEEEEEEEDEGEEEEET